MRFRTTRWMGLMLVVVASACSARGPMLGELDQDQLFQRGMEALETRDWNDAIAAFEQFTFAFPGDPRVAEARFRLGEAYMGKREYVTAAMEFNRSATEYPLSPWADDARFGVCKAYYDMAPAPPRDQEYTLTAIDHCRSLIAYYPESEFASDAERTITTLVNRLAEKDFDNAEYYFRRRAYHSANVYYEWVADNYPETVWAPRALLRLSESFTRLGYDQEAEAAKQRLLREFPTSPQAQQVAGATASVRP